MSKCKFEKIVRIEEGTFGTGKKLWHGREETMDGFKITTNKQEIFILIDNDQSCCEHWGYISSEDRFDDFIGAKILGINQVGLDLAIKNVKDFDFSSDEMSAVFINVETSKGTLQFALYNSHNGYYGHSYRIRSVQFNDEGSL